MALDKYSHDSDAVANLYRAALYLARGSVGVGIQFLAKAQERLGKKLDLQTSLLITNKEKYLQGPSDYSYWAEKILDQYQRLKNNL